MRPSGALARLGDGRVVDGRIIDGRPWGQAIHASAVAIAGFGLLILGPSGAGKSRLALALIAASKRACPIRLIGDDRILLTEDATGGLIARPHPRIGGFIERRGLGLVACPFIAAAPVRGLVSLTLATSDRASARPGLTTPLPPIAQNFPCFPAVMEENGRFASALRDAVLVWLRDSSTTPVAKAIAAPTGGP